MERQFVLASVLSNLSAVLGAATRHGRFRDISGGDPPIERLLVLGAASGMGRWLVEHVFGADPELEVTLADIDPAIDDVVARLRCSARIRGALVQYENEGLVGLEDLAAFDAVLVGVPTHAVQEVARYVLPELRDGTLVFDICSTKVEPMFHLLEAANGRLSVVGTHPLFGPGLSSPAGQQVVVCSTETSDSEHLRWLAGCLEAHGATVVRTSDPHEHDRYMAYVQVLTHFVYMAFVRTLQSDGLELSRAWDYQTPPFRYLAGFAGRVVSFGSPAKLSLYADIQIRTRYPEVRDSFVRHAIDLVDVFANQGAESAHTELGRISAYLTEQDSAVCQALTGSAIAAEQADTVSLRSVQRSGELCGLETERALRVGIVRELNAESITYDDVLVPGQGSGPFALVHSDDARRAALELGFHAAEPVSRTIPRQAARLVTGADLAKWLGGNLKHHARAVTIEAPRQAAPDRIAVHLRNMVAKVVRCELTDVFLPPHEPDVQRATYEVALHGSCPAVVTMRELASAASDFALVPPKPG